VLEAQRSYIISSDWVLSNVLPSLALWRMQCEGHHRFIPSVTSRIFCFVLARALAEGSSRTATRRAEEFDKVIQTLESLQGKIAQTGDRRNMIVFDMNSKLVRFTSNVFEKRVHVCTTLP
jgi:hypothetical protein